ncbi:30S ribosomal protein S2 [Candidatus Berkelbacteria bacterium CG_4_10_14_0_8_um_filter_35_9_33_8]|uniref:Small ribosomal subunit protein uS2 n=1 Tax=Candidatus Berkelbacteria bacterium CG_4_10_14_0_2_um_filter_35_9_33_12 TaxID=1974499 RepID=A0A2M7W4E4_9BACT|nr:MAG: 30S ribosomal protein S2 [Candidatus Berkelbacteria bacterium CG23_combo_of_CG06-09_8_20_14_all_33_15]PIZ28042.1 MAG: 30S ribosomal protein S2 [Candidatus Berkelbacteria bacterium CG_4_10_14_0_8_um_filter_35_9_33_8]PJA20644.1 MAG: 30S ribosomal protein S2 [Candidatus Berkelbacteria bacterium CG_4_10_14_0_2_um_filter_35_9_33_12]
MLKNIPDLEEMLKAGVHFGHQKAHSHPKSKKFVHSTVDKVQIINLEKTADQLEEFITGLKEIKKENKNVLWVGTKVQVRDFVASIAKKLNHNFIVKKWLPGLLTNLNSFKENLKTLNNMLEQKESDSYQKLNNKAKITFDKKLKNLSDLYEGIRNLSVLPDIMILCDPSVEINPYKEAQMLGIRTWAIGDTSSDPSGFEIFVSCNDDGKKSLRLIFDTIEKNI